MYLFIYLFIYLYVCLFVYLLVYVLFIFVGYALFEGVLVTVYLYI